jgi:hypothetical protein
MKLSTPSANTLELNISPSSGRFLGVFCIIIGVLIMFLNAPIWGVIFGGFFFIAFGGFIIAIMRRVKVIFDSERDLVKYQASNLIKAYDFEMKLSDVEKIDVVRPTDQRACYRLELIRRDGKSIPFTSSYNSGYSAKEKVAEKINAFIQKTK